MSNIDGDPTLNERVHILFAPASGDGLGGGHVMRCLSLAAALARRGVARHFACAEAGLTLVARFSEAPCARHEVTTRRELVDLSARLKPHAVVLDDYSVSADLEARLRVHAGAILAIDDLADRHHAADAVLDPGYGRQVSDYAKLAPRAALWLGPAFALLRPAFSGPARPRAAAARVDRVFVSFGLSDVGRVTARTLAPLRHALGPDVHIDVALASDAPSLPELRRMSSRDPRLTLHVDATDVASLIAAADLGVGAGGSTLWERASLGLASIAVAVADNQRPLVTRLTQAGAHVGLDLNAPDYESKLEAAVLGVAARERRENLARVAQALCDGRGAERAADALLAMIKARG